MSVDEALKTLGLEGGESPEQMRRAFRNMAMRYHPDRCPNFGKKAWATRRFIKAKNAYDFLMHSRAFGKMSDDFHVEDETSYDKSTAEQDYANEDLTTTRSFFDWVLDKLPNEDTFLGFIISIPLGILFMIGLVPYGFILEMLQNILEKLGWEPYPNSHSRKGRFAFLMITTISALIYLPVIFYLVYTNSEEKYPATVRIVIGITFSSMVILFVLSEWISFFLSEIWSHLVKTDLEIFLPIKRQE